MLRIKIFGLDIYGCREALERLDDYVDRELSLGEEAKVRQHLKICHQCARKFKFEEEFSAGVRDKVRSVAAPGDMDALKSKISVLLQQERVSPGNSDAS